MPSQMTQRPKGRSNTDGRYVVNVQLAGNGESQPPKKRIEHKQETVIMLVYSAIKNIANLKLAYSVWKPPTSSCSASGRSNGARFVSAIAATKKQKNPRICGQTFHPKMPRSGWCACALMISRRLKLPAMSSTPTTDIVSASS